MQRQALIEAGNPLTRGSIWMLIESGWGIRGWRINCQMKPTASEVWSLAEAWRESRARDGRDLAYVASVWLTGLWLKDRSWQARPTSLWLPRQWRPLETRQQAASAAKQHQSPPTVLRGNRIEADTSPTAWHAPLNRSQNDHIPTLRPPQDSCSLTSTLHVQPLLRIDPY